MLNNGIIKNISHAINTKTPHSFLKGERNAVTRV